MSLKFNDWLKENEDNKAADPCLVWQACLEKCSAHCREFGAKMLDEQVGGFYPALQYHKKFEELADQINQEGE